MKNFNNNFSLTEDKFADAFEWIYVIVIISQCLI